MTQVSPSALPSHAADLLAHILYKAGGGSTITTPGTINDEFSAQGQSILDRAMNKSGGSTPDSTSVTQSTSQGAPVTQGGDGGTGPVEGGTPGISQGYGGEGGHPGIDIATPLDSHLLAVSSGRVTNASNTDPGGYGLYVEITTDDGYKIRYGHLHSANVQVGDTVKAGQMIGTSGGEAGGANSGNSSGPHLHFEVDAPGGGTVDPTPWLAAGHAVTSAPPSSVTTSVSTSRAIDPEAAQAGNLISIAKGQHPTDGPEMQTTTSSSTTTTPGKNGITGNGSTSDSDPGAVDAFLAATRQHESGGDYHVYNQSGLSNASGAYQFIGSTWRSAGGSTQNAADASPEEQDRVARNMALQLFDQFHSWRLVAIAWYGGPGIAQQVANGQDPGSPDQQGGYLAYGDTISRMMQGGS